MSRWRRRLRRLRRVLVRVLAGCLILSGLFVALLSQLLPSLQSRPADVAAFMQRQLGLPVHVEAVRGEWTGSGVRLQLRGLRIGADDGPRVPDAVLWLRPFSGWWPGHTLSTLHIEGPRLEVEQSAEGGWQVRGLGLQSEGRSLDLQLLERLGEVVLDGASLRLRSQAQGLDLRLARVDARLRPQQGQLALALQVFIDKGPPLQLRLRASPDLAAGALHVGLRRAPLARWLGEALPGEPWRLPPSEASGDVWIDWSEGRLRGAQFEASLRAAPEPAMQGPALRAEGELLPEPTPLALRGTWRREADGHVLQLLEPSAGESQGWARLLRRADGLSLEAADWQFGAWWPWIAASLPLDQSERIRLQALAAHGRIEALRLHWPQQGEPRWWAALDGLGSQRFAGIPGVSGLDLRLEGLGDRVLIEVRADPLGFDWRSLEGLMQPQLRGRLMLWREQADAPWCLQAIELSLREPDYAVEVEGGLCFDGGAPSADLRLAVAPAEITVAKRFWILDNMPPPAVNWLNRALEGGRLAGGALLLHGDLSDWPFRGNQGRMEALALLEALQLRFHPEWPVGEALSGEARFINDALEVEGQARLAGIEVHRVSGRIPRYRNSRLLLDLEADAEAARLLGLLPQTPLWKTLAPGLERVRAEGPAGVELGLDIPLRAELGSPRVSGRVTLEEADLSHDEWGLALDGANGRLRLSERGVQADGLEVLHAGRPARFALRVGSFVEDPGQRVEAELAGRLDVGALIDTQPELDWLKPALDGVSGWMIGLSVPLAGDQRPRLTLRSDLVGTALRLPAPLRKSAATPLPLALEVGLAEADKQVQLELGELLRLSGRWASGEAFSGVAAFASQAGAERPERGLRVIGQVPALDLGGWLGLAGQGGGLLESLDLRSGDFDLFGRSFGEVRLQYRSGVEGLRVVLEGERLQGEVEVPEASQLAQRGITARFKRMHWPADFGRGNGSGGAMAEGLDPASIPPLHLHIEDLRLGEAQLGNTRLETYPQQGALHVEQFTSRSAALSLSARGDWLAGDAGGRSRFSVEFTAEDLGNMLQALGFAGFVEGGQTLATLEGEWPGAPTAFALDAISGRLALSVGSGRIPDVDPGAGRLFGLFSLSEIPRRLALDFSDFFRSGLAFNRIEGEFRLEDGSAWTDQLLIDSPSAEIRLRGRTGFQQQEYAQTMEVLPRAGNVLPVVGALAGGPAGAALGAVAQAVLQKPFKQITRTLYSVSGSWDAPRIEVIERGPARPAGPGENGVPGP